MKKILLTLFIGIFLISFASAGLENQGSGDQNQNFTINQVCSDATYTTLSTIQYPDRTIQIINTNMTSVGGGSYQYNFTNTTQIGRYDVAGISDGCSRTFSFYFTIGEELNTGRAIAYIGFIIIILFTFFLTIYGASLVRWKHLRSDEGKIITINHFRYVKIFLFTIAYFELMFLFGLSYKFFSEANIEGFTQFFNFVYQLFLNLIVPLIIFLIITIFVIWINNKNLSKRLNLGLDK
ncbi:hypothetical protein LCGC14_0687410 [marine sediment metagenome]|uniref:Uncharacterized protein n=1 Tax=marine sediment metagenome TaxID=412755 RepID=A0A0F9QLD1_9ZZZZ